MKKAIRSLGICLLIIAGAGTQRGGQLAAQASGHSDPLLTVAGSLYTGAATELKTTRPERLGRGAKPVVISGRLEADREYTMKRISPVLELVQKQDLYGKVLGDEFFFYRALLNDSERKVYELIYANACALVPDFDMPTAINRLRFTAAVQAVFYDNPDLFWLKPTVSYTYNKNKVLSVHLSFDFAVPIEQYRAVFTRCADSILERAQAFDNDIEKVKFLHDVLITICKFQPNAYDQSAYSALVLAQSSSAGYSRAFQYLCQRLGIPCAYIAGTATGAHAWNLVRLYGEFYAMDCTWDDPIGSSAGEYSYTYFNVTDSFLALTHIRDDLSKALPTAEGTLYGYQSFYKNKPGSDFAGIEYGKPRNRLPALYVLERTQTAPLTRSSPNAARINVSPPSWILGNWVDTNRRDAPYMSFSSNNIVVNKGAGINEDLSSSRIMKFVQAETQFSYEIRIEYSDASWWSEKFTKPMSGGQQLSSIYSDSSGGNVNYLYRKQ
ncbi:transglutaminase domain-containing protein [Breznakiellaceae bacterium SP9]